MDDLECVPYDSDGFGFFTSVSAVELEWTNKTLDDGAKCFSEFLSLVSACSVGDEDLSFDWFGCDVVNEAGIFDLFEMSVTLMSSYDHLEKSLGAFSKVILEDCSSSMVTFCVFATGLDMWFLEYIYYFNKLNIFNI